MSIRTGIFTALLVFFTFAPDPLRAGTYTLELTDNTGLKSTEFSIYAMGFSIASQMVMDGSGAFVSQSTGTVQSYKVGAGGVTQITLDDETAFTGGRIYFFVAPVGGAAPTVMFGSQPTNPPSTDFPPFSILELTVPAATGMANPATIDIQTVDGFIFPLTVTLNGATNAPGSQFGQPVYTPGQPAPVNRADIFKAYTSFMTAEGAAGLPFQGLLFDTPGIANQAGGILNPGAFLTTINATNEFQNLDSALNKAFNSDLGTLFGTSTLNVQGVASNPGGIPTQAYTATPVMETYPGTAVSLPALKFVNGMTEFHVFNPVGISVLTDDADEPITGTINGTMLTLDSAVSGLTAGMYVSGAGSNISGAEATTQITAVNSSTSLTLNQNLSTPAPGSQYRFSKLPQLVMFQTPGQMVFANSGVFADSTTQFAPNSAEASVLGNLENQIVSAFNRGIAVHATALNPGTAGGTSAFWGDQRNWYPTSGIQNLFSLFMHTGAVSGTPIFFQPLDAATWPNARNQVMGSAYGFAYDESGGPVPPAPMGQPEVPSKFDQNVPPGSTIQVTFGPWTSPVSLSAPLPTASGVERVAALRDIRKAKKKLKKAKRAKQAAKAKKLAKKLKKLKQKLRAL